MFAITIPSPRTPKADQTWGALMRAMFHSTSSMVASSAPGRGSGIVKTGSSWISPTSFRRRIRSRSSGPLVTRIALRIQNDL